MSGFSRKDDTVSIIIEMMNDRSGLWQITPDRVRVISDSCHLLSARTKPAANEMLVVHRRGDRFWELRAEYYLVLNEIKAKSTRVDKETLEAAIASISDAAQKDGMMHREWVKMALDVMSRISKNMSAKGDL